jgi:hypothetical protein
MTNIREKQFKGGKIFLFCFLFCSHSVHHSGGDVVDQSSSPHVARKWGEAMTALTGFSFVPFHSKQASSLWVVPPTFREDLAHLVNLLWKYPHRDTQRHALLICLALPNPIMLIRLIIIHRMQNLKFKNWSVLFLSS